MNIVEEKSGQRRIAKKEIDYAQGPFQPMDDGDE
jgi:hypothetical protein